MSITCGQRRKGKEFYLYHGAVLEITERELEVEVRRIYVSGG